MKALVTAAEVRTFAKTGSRMMTVNPGDIVTPAAWDEAKEIGVTIEYGAERPAAPAKPQEPQNVDAAFLAKVVNEVIACLQQSKVTVQGMERTETTRVDNVVANGEIPASLFEADAFFPGVSFVDSFEKIGL